MQYYIFSLFFLQLSVMVTTQLIDPHDMGFEKTSLKSNCPVQLNTGIIHYKHLINLLLKSMVVDKTETNIKGNLFLNIPMKKYSLLKEFAQNSADDALTIKRINLILNDILTKPLHQEFVEFLITWTDHIYFTFYNRTTGILLSCLLIVFVSFKLLKANLTISFIIKYLIFLGWIVDFAFTWVNLLQEAEINRLADSLRYQAMPPHCDPTKMSWWQYVWYSISSEDECRNFHQNIYKDHFWSIAPLTVMSHQLGILILTPAAHVGQALAKLTGAILSHLPWGVNFILLPLLLIFFLIILCISFSFITNTSFGFNFFHVLNFHFGSSERHSLENMITGSNLTKLIDIVHRNMVEDVKSTKNEIEKEEDAKSENENVKRKKASIHKKPKEQIKCIKPLSSESITNNSNNDSNNTEQNCDKKL